MKENVWLFLLIIFVFIVGILIQKILRKHRLHQLKNSIKNEDITKFYKLVNSTITKALFPPYNREYLKLNALIIEDNEKQIDEQFNKLFKFHLTETQKTNLLSKALDYYLKKENKTKCKEILSNFKSTKNQFLYQEALKTYKIFLENCSDYIPEMEKQLISTTDETKKRYLAYLLSIQYSNKEDQERSKYYKDLSLGKTNP